MADPGKESMYLDTWFTLFSFATNGLLLYPEFQYFFLRNTICSLVYSFIHLSEKVLSHTADTFQGSGVIRMIKIQKLLLANVLWQATGFDEGCKMNIKLNVAGAFLLIVINNSAETWILPFSGFPTSQKRLIQKKSLPKWKIFSNHYRH